MSGMREKADDLMRKASEAFGKGRTQKAYGYYEKAVDTYRNAPESSEPRIALAWYTRALLLLQGDATGDVARDLDEGEAVVRSGAFPEALRFQGLFAVLRARWRRQHDDLDAAQEHLDAARRVLAASGRPTDLFSLECEQIRLAVDRRMWTTADVAARAALDRADSPAQRITAWTLQADAAEAAGDDSACIEALDRAASVAYDNALKQPLWDLQDRLRHVRTRHGVADGDAPNADA